MDVQITYSLFLSTGGSFLLLISNGESCSGAPKLLAEVEACCLDIVLICLATIKIIQ